MNCDREKQMKAFGRLLDVLDVLRDECPWDKKQTNQSLRPNTIEEVYELCDALVKDDTKQANLPMEYRQIFWQYPPAQFQSIIP